jgi:GAF domain-containing protein
MAAEDLSERIAAAARDMEGELDPSATMEIAVRRARELVPGAQEAGISLVDRDGRVESPAVTSDVVARIDELQYEVNEGPCLDAIREHEVVQSADVGADDRWPQWGPAAAEETGLRSMMCFRLFTHSDKYGALNFYSRRSDAFDEVDREHGLALAAHTAIAMAAAQQVDHLKVGMDGRTIIGQAQGILMERFDLDPDRAFAVLARTSSQMNRKLRDVAFEVVQTRRLPGHPIESGQSRHGPPAGGAAGGRPGGPTV